MTERGLLLPSKVSPSQDKPNSAANSHPGKVTENLAPKLVTFGHIDRNSVERKKKCGVIPETVTSPLQNKADSVAKSHRNKVAEKPIPKLITFVDQNGVELTVTHSKY
eukprot:TCONS_00030506-protein